MKKLITILLLVPVVSFAQKGKPVSIDSVLLRNNILYQYVNGQEQERGSVISGGGGAGSPWFYDPIYGSYYAEGSGRYRTHPGRWNFVAGDGAGDSMTAEAMYNVFIGPHVGGRNKRGRDNIGLGYDVLFNNTSGVGNVAFSQDALFNNTTGSDNGAFAKFALYSNKTGMKNTALSFNNFYYLISGEGNLAGGPYAGGFIERGDGNIFFGRYAGEGNDHAAGRTINDMIAIGSYTGLSKVFSRSISIGYNIQPKGDDMVNIGNVYEGNSITGMAEVKKLSIGGKEISFDDNYMYVQTSTGIKRVPLQEISAARSSKAVTVNSNQTVPIYGVDGKMIGYATFQIK